MPEVCCPHCGGTDVREIPDEVGATISECQTCHERFYTGYQSMHHTAHVRLNRIKELERELATTRERGRALLAFYGDASRVRDEKIPDALAEMAASLAHERDRLAAALRDTDLVAGIVYRGMTGRQQDSVLPMRAVRTQGYEKARRIATTLAERLAALARP